MTGPEEATRAAARWDARLRAPDCTDEERAAFEAWRASDPANRTQFDRLQAATALLRHMHAGTEDAPIAAPARTRWTRWGSIGVAACLPVVALVSAFLVSERSAEIEYHAAADGRPVTFADGATALLGPGAAIRVKQHAQGPEVRLVSGQATFSVSDRGAHPLVIYAADRNITASGTTFGIGLSPGRVQVSLIRGKARIGCWHGLLPSVVTLHQGQRITAEVGSDRSSIGTIA